VLDNRLDRRAGDGGRGVLKRRLVRATAGRVSSPVNMMRYLSMLAFASMGAVPFGVQAAGYEMDKPPHNYWQRTPADRFAKLRAGLASGSVVLEASSERAYLVSLLRELGISPASQMLVFSTTSLQLRLISPRNPRAIYFNEDVYIGFIPGGRIEVVAVDPELGGIFYIFDIPPEGGSPRIERATRCMNCHAGEETGRVPGLLIKSVVPGPSGGSLKAFRQELMGHAVPLAQRFGGWHVTGAGDFTNHWGNLTGRLSPQGLIKIPVHPGDLFSYARYPVATSDLLAHLLHEHQAGFVNRAIEATYRTRAHLDADKGRLTAAHAADLDQQARALTLYLLFADEVLLPAGGVTGDAVLKADFLQNRRATRTGAALKDLDLRTRLFKHRCSYMIYSAAFQGLPAEMKGRVYGLLAKALATEKPAAEYAYLPAAEKQAIRQILRETLADLPGGW